MDIIEKKERLRDFLGSFHSDESLDKVIEGIEVCKSILGKLISKTTVEKADIREMLEILTKINFATEYLRALITPDIKLYIISGEFNLVKEAGAYPHVQDEYFYW